MNVKNGGILVGCQASEDNIKFRKIVEEKLYSYDVKEVVGVASRVCVVGIREILDEEEQLKYIVGI